MARETASQPTRVARGRRQQPEHEDRSIAVMAVALLMGAPAPSLGVLLGATGLGLAYAGRCGRWRRSGH